MKIRIMINRVVHKIWQEAQGEVTTVLNMTSIIEDDSTSYKVLKLLLQSSSDLFFSYLTNRELGIIDQIITDVNLRQLFFKQTEHFYLSNKIKSLGELKLDFEAQD